MSAPTVADGTRADVARCRAVARCFSYTPGDRLFVTATLVVALRRHGIDPMTVLDLVPTIRHMGRDGERPEDVASYLVEAVAFGPAL